MKKGYLYRPWFFFFREYVQSSGDWSLSKTKAVVVTEQSYQANYSKKYHFEEIPESESSDFHTMDDHWPGGAR